MIVLSVIKSNMSLKILKILVTVLIFSRTSHQVTPEDRCAVTESGSVCLDCFRSGTCVANGDGTFTVEFNFKCPEFGTPPRHSFCDDTVNTPQSFGTCSPLPDSATSCSCSSSSQCIADANNPSVVLHCEYSTPVTDPPCAAPALDLTTCSCSSCPDSCPFLENPDDDCSNYFLCSGIDLFPYSCPGNSCFDQEYCGCQYTSTIQTTVQWSTMACPTGCSKVDDPYDNCQGFFLCTESGWIHLDCTYPSCFDQESCGCVGRDPTVTTLQTTTQIPPLDCFFIDDPNDNCSKYFAFVDNSLYPLICSEGTCFNQEACSCVKSPILCPSDCPFSKNPSGDCGSYFVCSGDELISVNCNDGLCFDQESCGCVLSQETSTAFVTTTQTSPNCPYLDDPSDDCGSYFILDGTTLIPASCYGNLCFDPVYCGCIEILPTCSVGCPFVDDPNDDCQSYFVCSGDELISVNCNDGLCFDQESCGCVLSQETSTAFVTTTQTSPPNCPYLDDPSDDCGSFFILDGTTLIPASCYGNLCFDPVYCGCIEILPTCSAGCPFVDDPNDDCQSYFVCTGNNLIAVNCSGTLCFDQASCGCVQSGRSSSVPVTTTWPPTTTTTRPTTTTTSQLTCPPNCPFVNDPTSCESYFVCTGGGLTPITCSDTLCFDQESCGCVPMTELPSISSACPPGCPFVDDPDDNCQRYYVCDGDNLIPYECTGSLCFDQSTCSCQ